MVKGLWLKKYKDEQHNLLTKRALNLAWYRASIVTLTIEIVI